MRNIWYMAFAVGLLFSSSSVALASISFDANAPTAPQPQFGFYCNPYNASFVSGGYYTPAGGYCTYLLPQQQMISQNIFLGVYKGTPGNAKLVEWDYGPTTTSPYSILQTNPNDWTGLQGDDFFAAAVGYNNFDSELLPENAYLTSGGTAPLPYSLLPWKWGTPPAPPISIAVPQQGTAYVSTDSIILQATIDNLASYGSIAYLLNGMPIDPTQPLPIATLPLGTTTLVIAATNSAGNTIYATSTFMIVSGQPPATSPLTVTADSKTVQYGSALPALTATLSGFVNGDTASSNDVTGSASCTTTATNLSAAGTYPITCTAGTLSSTNYIFSSFVAGTLTITKADQTITPSILSNITAIVGTTITLNASASSGLPVTYSVSGPCSVSGNILSLNDIGTCTVVAHQAGDNNYNAAPDISRNISIDYRWDGFLQPINDTAHQIGQGLSVFKGGSTIPVKLQLKKADGTVVQAAVAPYWSTPILLGPMSTAVDELVYSDPASSGSSFKWDGSQYQYNWSTKGLATSKWYLIYAILDDGTVQSVVIGLK